MGTARAINGRLKDSRDTSSAGKSQTPLRDGNESLERTIRDAIQRRAGGAIQGLAVTVVEGRVVLRGRSMSFYRKQLAQEAAIPFLGGRQLANLIVVE